MKEDLNELYFAWLISNIDDGSHDVRSYNTLLRYLHELEFYWVIPMDMNRAQDGQDLRNRFAFEHGMRYDYVERYLDSTYCTVLEMLISLSINCEELIMSNDNYGNRTGLWFWTMVENLGLGSMDDTNYRKQHVDFVISRFLNRDYKYNGEGGLFTVNNGKDLRKEEIWYQMNWYLSYISA